MKLKMFEAEVEVLGKTRSAQYAEGGLMLTGLSYEEALEVLRRVEPAIAGGKSLPVAAAVINATPSATTEKTTEKQATRSSDDRVSKPAQEPEFPVTSKADLKVAKELEGVQEPGSDGAEVPEKILKSTRFIEVMEWVMTTKKLKPVQVDEIVAGCEALKEVPAVRRVRDIRDKVISNLAAYAEAGAGDAA